MGLRPSVRGDSSPRRRMSDDYESASGGNSSPNNEGVIRNDSSSETQPSSPRGTGSVSSPDLPPPRREAWTARGKLLLNFHDVISRAINSPEMAKKCSQIAYEFNEAKMEDAVDAGNHGSVQAHNPTSIQDTSVPNYSGDYGAEAALIVENKQKRDAEVRNKSAAVGLFAFLSLRGWPWIRRGVGSWISSLSRSSAAKGYTFERLPTGAAEYSESTLARREFLRNEELRQADFAKLQRSKTVSDNQAGNTWGNKLKKSVRFSFDAAFSTAIGFFSGAFIFVPRPSAYIEDMSKLPMVEGKSVYAEMVCPPLLGEYRKVLDQYGGRWPVKGPQDSSNVSHNNYEKSALTQEDVSLNVIRDFVANCSKRSKYERALLEERDALDKRRTQSSHSFPGSVTAAKFKERLTRKKQDLLRTNTEDAKAKKLAKLGTVVVPSPGVPTDIAINIDKDVLLLIDERDDNKPKSNDCTNNTCRR